MNLLNMAMILSVGLLASQKNGELKSQIKDI